MKKCTFKAQFLMVLDDINHLYEAVVTPSVLLAMVFVITVIIVAEKVIVKTGIEQAQKPKLAAILLFVSVYFSLPLRFSCFISRGLSTRTPTTDSKLNSCSAPQLR